MFNIYEYFVVISRHRIVVKMLFTILSYRLDIVVEDDIIIELKAVDKILSEHRAQLFNYLRITQKPIGLLLNFGKSVYVEKYIYDADTNDVSFFSTKSNRG